MRPLPDEAAPYYHGYIELVPEGPILGVLANQAEEVRAFLSEIGEDRAGLRYAPDKWSIKQVVGHITDAERVFAFRAFHIARGDQSPLPGMEQDDYVRAYDFDARTLESLVEELYLARAANLAFIEGLHETGIDLGAATGTASGVRFTLRSLLYILAGHMAHHVDVLRTRYLSPSGR